MSLEYSQKSVAIETKTFFIRGVRITRAFTFKSKTLNMEGNKRHPQFTLESDTKQTHFFVERTLLPRAPFARRGFIHIGKRQIKTRGFVETVLKSRKTFVVRRQKQSSIQTHFHSKLYGKYQLKAHTLIGIIYNARKNQDACRTNTTSA